jgi:hypothetical protein
MFKLRCMERDWCSGLSPPYGTTYSIRRFGNCISRLRTVGNTVSKTLCSVRIAKCCTKSDNVSVKADMQDMLLEVTSQFLQSIPTSYSNLSRTIRNAVLCYTRTIRKPDGYEVLTHEFGLKGEILP